MPQRWRLGQPCATCDYLERERRRQEEGPEERRRWEEELGPPPAELTIRDHTGRVVTSTALARRRRRR